MDSGAVGVEVEGSSASRLRTLISTGRPVAKREISRESLLEEGERKEYELHILWNGQERGTGEEGGKGGRWSEVAKGKRKFLQV